MLWRHQTVENVSPSLYQFTRQAPLSYPVMYSTSNMSVNCPKKSQFYNSAQMKLTQKLILRAKDKVQFKMESKGIINMC